MSTRRAAALLPVVLLAVTITSQPAHAQGEPQVAITLQRQTPWVTLNDRSIVVEVRATNQGSTRVDALAVAVALGTPVLTRGEYETSLLSGPAVTPYARSFSEDGSLAPGQARTLSVSVDLATSLAISRVDSRIYPMKISVLSHGSLVSNELRMPLLSFVKAPQLPLSFTWSVDLTSAPVFGPDGRLDSTTIETSIAPGGALRSEVEALATVAGKHVAVDVVVLPLLLDELQGMSLGYTRTDGTTVKAGEGDAANATAVLQALRRVAASSGVELSAYPFAGVSISSLFASGLRGDVAVQLERGRDVTQRILGKAPSTAVARANGGVLDHASIETLAGNGGTVFLGNADAVQRSAGPLEFLLPPTASIATSPSTSAPIVVPDTGTQTILNAIGGDPVLGAQQALGEMMAAWQEHPGDARGIAISLAGLPLPAGFWEPFANRVAGAPFLHPMTATDLVQAIPPPDTTSDLAPVSSQAFSKAYGAAIKRERKKVVALGSMLVGESTLPDQLGEDLLIAESGAYVGNEGVGRAWYDAVEAATARVFAATDVSSQRFTLTSHTGSIPVVLGDPGNLVLNVRVRLSSSLLSFPNGNTQAVKLDGPRQFLRFDVVAERTGQIPVQVQVIAPSGFVVSQTTIFVRSTAFNRIALFITLGAALLLVALWVRRFLRRPTS